MIASLKRAIVHILDANSGVSVYSEEELDVTDASINSFITKIYTLLRNLKCYYYCLILITLK